MEPSHVQRRQHNNHIPLWKLGEVSLGLCCKQAWEFTVPNWSCKQRKIAKANALAFVGATRPAWKPPIYPALIDQCYIPHTGEPVKASRREGGYLSSEDGGLSCAV